MSMMDQHDKGRDVHCGGGRIGGGGQCGETGGKDTTSKESNVAAAVSPRVRLTKKRKTPIQTGRTSNRATFWFEHL